MSSMASLSCQCGETCVEFAETCPRWRLLCCCDSCWRKNAWSVEMRKRSSTAGTSTPPVSLPRLPPCDLIYFGNAFVVRRGGQHLRLNKMTKSTNCYAACCHTILLVDHPAYSTNVVMSFLNTGAVLTIGSRADPSESGCGVMLEPQRRIYEEDLTAAELSSLGTFTPPPGGGAVLPSFFENPAPPLPQDGAEHGWMRFHDLLDRLKVEALPKGPGRFCLTAFGPFNGVAANPTMALLACPAIIAAAVSCDVVETSIEGVQQALDALAAREASEGVLTGDEPRCLVHFGVDVKASTFALERTAYNEMHFRCPDERGNQPNHQRIWDDEACGCPRSTSVDVPHLAAQLTDQGFPTVASGDPGRFVCNYLYYSSIRRMQHLSARQTTVLFVHVPPFAAIPERTQVEFVLALLQQLEVAPTFYCADSESGLGESVQRMGEASSDSVDEAKLRQHDAEMAERSSEVSSMAAVLQDMGFAPEQARAALEATGYTTVEDAMLWLLAATGQGDGQGDGQDDSGSPAAQGRPMKLVLVARKDLQMGAGKLAAQCCHAALGATRGLDSDPSSRWAWEQGGEATVVVRAKDAAEVGLLEAQAKARGLPTHAVRDAGRTQVAAGTLTVLAIGPAAGEDIDRVTGRLQLY